MKTQPTRLALAFATALGTLAALPAHALVITTAIVNFSNSASVTDAEGGSATTNNNASLGTSSISQFDSANGVLTGTTLNLSSTRTQTTQVTSTAGGGSGANSSVTSAGSGGSTANISAPGVNTTFSSITGSDSCTDKRKESCTGTATVSDTPTNANLSAAGNLNDYVGVGMVDVTRTAPTLSATQADNVFTGTESTAYSVNWAGTVSATYDYLLHAAASFDGSNQLVLNLNFGPIYLGDPASDLGFSIFNAAGDRVGLDLDGYSAIGDWNQLSLSGFSGTLAAGTSQSFFASFLTSSLGAFSATYNLNLSDADVGAASSRYNYGLTVNLTGRVIDREQVSAIPEPGVLGLLGIGLLGLAMGRRNRR